MPADAKGDAADAAKDEISNVELTIRERRAESDSKKPGENAKQVEEQAQAKDLAEGKSPDLYMGHRFALDVDVDKADALARWESLILTQPENDFGDDGLKDPTALRKKNAAKPTDDEFWSRQYQAEGESDVDGDGIRDGVWADKEMAQSTIGLGTADEKNSLLTDADKPQVLERNQALAQTNPEDQVESLTRLGVFSGMQGNSDSKKSSQIVAEQGRPLERANALSEKMQSLEKLKEQFGDDHPEVLKVQKGIEKELEEEVNRLGEKMREAQASEAKTVAPTRQLMQIVRPELRTRKPNLPSAGLNETSAAAEAFSTFSLHVSDVSFKLAAAALAKGEWPEASKIRIEEFVNAFDYGDPLPGKGEKVACAVEQGIHPFLQQRNVLRVSMRTSAEGRATNTPLRLTFVLDNSGSMERIDRQQTVRRAFTLLSKQLTAIDQVTLISFSRQPRLLAENVSGTESGKLVELMEQLPSEGGTNIEAALQLAFEKASAQQTPGAQNRIVLLTDGAVNLGNANPESLSQMVESMRAAGIAFDAAGISADGLNDEVLEALTRKGDGRYYLMDSGEAADDNFAQQIAGALRPSASNVKVQVECNPKRVGQYKLLGFEKHLLKQEDFRNDAVDAAEMAAAEAGVAMYQFEAKPDGEGDVGSVSVRFRDLSTGEMVEHRWPIPYEPEAARPDQATPSLRIATTAAMLAAKLKGEALGESVDLQTLSQLIDSLPSQMQSQTRVQQLKLMIEQARQMSAK
jgi:Mg-chelatase subunit ChlD